jgi:hypothetical protein
MSRCNDIPGTWPSRTTEYLSACIKSSNACRDLLKLRLKTAEAYVKVLTGEAGGGQGPDKTYSQVSLTVTIVGLGPDFQVVAKVPHLLLSPVFFVGFKRCCQG